MKIAILIATRGRPHQVVGLIEGMRTLATGDHEIEFLVACDDDDPCDSYQFIWDYNHSIPGIRDDIEVDVAPRPTSPSECWNRLAKLTDAEALVTLPDDGVIATPRWDHCINWAWRNHNWAHPDLKIGGLTDMANQGQPTLFVMSPKWIEFTGHVFDARFPFWYADTAIAETYSFITGTGLPMLPINFASKGGQWNPRLRRMSLWWTLYTLTRRERLANAESIRRTLNLATPPNLAQLEALWVKRDIEGLPASEEIVRQIDKPAPLDARYLEAERAAIEYVRSHGGRTFEPSTHDGDRF